MGMGCKVRYVARASEVPGLKEHIEKADVVLDRLVERAKFISKQMDSIKEEIATNKTKFWEETERLLKESGKYPSDYNDDKNHFNLEMDLEDGAVNGEPTIYMHTGEAFNPFEMLMKGLKP